MKPTVIVIAGPTASGKSGIGIELAQKINGTVISADSMQIYNKLDIGTAKVTKAEAQDITHELIDFLDISEKFSVMDYKKMCYEKIQEVLSMKKVPIIVGGTGLYINAVVNNMSFDEENTDSKKEVQEKFIAITSNKSSEELFKLLNDMDPEAALKIGKGNDKRILRAIKLNLLGVKKSSIDKKDDLWNKNESEYNFLTVYVDMPRDLLYDRINKRVDQMVEAGVLEEAKLLNDMKNMELTACQAIGYKEFFPYLNGECELKECVELLKQKTRNYAKRQITWFKKLKDKYIVDGTKTKEKIVEDILKEYYEKNTDK